MSQFEPLDFSGILLPPRGGLRVLSLLAGNYLHGVCRAADVLTGARYLLAITRLGGDTAAELACQWKDGPLPIPGHPGFYFVAEVEGEGRPLTHHLGRRHPIAEAAGLVAQLLGLALSAGDTTPLLHPELIRVRSALGRLEITSVATRCARLLSLSSSEFVEPLWAPSCLSPEGIRGAVPNPSSVVFSSATLLWWLVHGVPPFGILPLEELQRLVNPNLQSLPPLLAHVADDGPDVDAALRERLFGPPASRLTPETWVHLLTELSQNVRPSEPPSRADEKWSCLTGRRLESASDFLADGACQSLFLLRSTIEALQAAAFRGAIPEPVRADFRDVACAILRALSKPVGQTIEVSWRGKTVTMPCGQGPYFRIAAPRFSESDPSRSWFAVSELTLIWAVATALQDDIVLDLFGALPLNFEHDDRYARFVQALIARSAGSSSRALLECAMQVASRTFAMWGDCAPWIQAFLALDPINGSKPVLCRLVERGDPTSVLGAFHTCAANRSLAYPFPDDDFVDDPNAEVDWFTLALLEVARCNGIAVPTTGELLVRWPATAQAPVDLRKRAAEGTRGVTLRLLSSRLGTEQRSGMLELTGEGRVRVMRDLASARTSGWVGRPRAVALMARVAALWSELNAESAVGRELASRKAAFAGAGLDGPVRLEEVLLILEADGETRWWRLPESPWANALCDELTKLALEIGEPETTQHIQKLAPQSLRTEFRLLVDKAIIEGSPDFLELLLERTPFSVYELELTLEVLGLDKGKGRPQGGSIQWAERCINEALIRARARG